MNLNDIHYILFNAHIIYSLIMGIWAASLAVRSIPLSGNFWGAVASITVVAAIVLVVGIIMTAQGYRPARIETYYLYMAWLVVIMPGMFTLLRGRDDRSAAIAFAILSFFNAATSISMSQRLITGPWVLPS